MIENLRPHPHLYMKPCFILTLTQSKILHFVVHLSFSTHVITLESEAQY